MEKTQDYVVCSLELHLFFARIMKEHSFFLKVGFLPPNADLAGQGERLMRNFEHLLSRAIALSNHVVCQNVLDSGEIVTEFTDLAERQTQRLSGTFIDRRLTARAMQLKGRDCGTDWSAPPMLTRQIQQLNRDGLQFLQRLIAFKEGLLQRIGSCNLFTSNYPLLIEHILREARLYREQLMQLEGLRTCSCQDLRDSELFWNQIMMEHALFIRGLLDPCENDLIQTSDGFAKDYATLLARAREVNDQTLIRRESLQETIKFRDFKATGAQGIQNCKIRSVILPLLTDHVLREANHYIRLLRE